MVKEKLIHWRNVHSPLLYDVAKHINGPAKYWDIRVVDGSTPLERAVGVLLSKGLNSEDFRVVKFETDATYEVWDAQLESGEWDLTLRAEGFGLLMKKEGTERKNLTLRGRLRFFNS